MDFFDNDAENKLEKINYTSKKRRKQKFNDFKLPENRNTPVTLSGSFIQEKIKNYCLEIYNEKKDLFHFLFIILIGFIGIGIFKYITAKKSFDVYFGLFSILISLYIFIKTLPKYLKYNWIIKQLQNNKFVIKKLTILDLKTKENIYDKTAKLYVDSNNNSKTKYKIVTDGGIFPVKKRNMLDGYMIGESCYFVLGLSANHQISIIENFPNHEDFWNIVNTDEDDDENIDKENE